MPTLHWIGKDKVINHHREVPFKILEHKYTWPQLPEMEYIDDDNELRPNRFLKPVRSDNKIIHGDNLEALKALLPEYEGRIKCIYIDPPYNTGNEGWVYNDNVNHPKIKKWLGQVVGKESEDLSRHDKWLCMMYPRLKLLHKLLADDGAIFISLDENETHNIRLVLNEIFGESKFISQLTLLCNPKGRSQDKYFSTNHEYCTVYSKSILPKGYFSVTKDEYRLSKDYKLKDENGQFRLLELRNTHREFNRQTRPNLYYPFFADIKTGKVSLERVGEYTEEIYPLWPDGFSGCWTWGKELSFKDNHLLIAKKSKNTWKIYRKSYSESSNGETVKKNLFTIWQDPLFFTEKGQSTFGEIFPGLNKNDFPQPKSVDYIQEIIRTITNKDSIILDSFAGSGTTAHAVLNLNKQDGGNRKFILVEMEDYAETITAERVKRVINGYASTEGTGGSFDFYELGKPLFVGENNEYLNEEVALEKIQEYIWYSETKTPFVQPAHKDTNQYYLGKKEGLALYFIYEKDCMTELNYDMLATIKTKADQYIVYADSCLLPKEFMIKNNIAFKKIPRDITRF